MSQKSYLAIRASDWKKIFSWTTKKLRGKRGNILFFYYDTKDTSYKEIILLPSTTSSKSGSSSTYRLQLHSAQKLFMSSLWNKHRSSWLDIQHFHWIEIYGYVCTIYEDNVHYDGAREAEIIRYANIMYSAFFCFFHFFFSSRDAQ